MTRKLTLVASVLALTGLLAAASARADDDRSSYTRWIATWTAASMPPGSTFVAAHPGFENQTVRHIVKVSVGGRRVRIRLSNVFGDGALRIGRARVALHASGASIVPDSDREITFGGRSSVSIQKGAIWLSDPVNLEVPTHGRLAVSLYLPGPTGSPTYHEVTMQSSYVSIPGDFTDAVDMPVEGDGDPTPSRFFLSAVEVMPREEVGVIAAFGDSITTGGRSTPDAYRTWPDLLSARLNPRYGSPRMSVLNLGVGCARLLTDQCGQKGILRFDRDVLTAAGATHVVIAIGLNDIGMPTFLQRPHEIVSANDIIDGLRQLAERARAQGLSVIGATLTPVGSITAPGYYTPENEAKRQAVNAWIRTSRAFDGVVDFDRAVRDPRQPNRLLEAYNSDDGIHLNDAGYQAMANAFDLSLFR